MISTLKKKMDEAKQHLSEFNPQVAKSGVFFFEGEKNMA